MSLNSIPFFIHYTIKISEVSKAYGALGTSICPDRLIKPNPAQTPIVYDFETKVGSTHSSKYAFCGSYSLKSPKVIRITEVPHLNKYPYVSSTVITSISKPCNVSKISESFVPLNWAANSAHYLNTVQYDKIL